MPAEVEKAIRASLADRKDLDGSQPLFASLSNNSKGGRMSTRSISGTVKTALVKAGYDSDRLTAHSLRATAATAAFEAGLTLFEVQQLMGHCDPATTEIYIKDQNQLSIEKKGRIAIDQYLKGELHNAIMPELEAEIMTMTAKEQAALLAQIRAQKGAK